MKKVIFLLATFFFTLTTVKAEKSNAIITKGYGESFNFVHNNINFMVYQNGEFDFFIQPDNFVAAEFHLNGVNISYNSGYNYDAYVQYDDYGAIIQIEDTPIFYDYYGRISRIGNTHIRYNNRRLVQFGGLYVYYNRFGYFDYCRGYINPFNRVYTYYPYFTFYTRPVFANCIVSYRPYRRYYAPVRYRYNSVAFHRSVSRRSNAIARRSVVRRSVPQRVERVSNARTASRSNTQSRAARNTARRSASVNTSRGTTVRNDSRNTTVRNSSRGTTVRNNSRGTTARSSSRGNTVRTSPRTSTQRRELSSARTSSRNTQSRTARSSNAQTQNRTSRPLAQRSSRSYQKPSVSRSRPTSTSRKSVTKQTRQRKSTSAKRKSVRR